MRQIENLSKYIIPEWKQCYIDYNRLHIFVVLINTLMDYIHTLQELDQLDQCEDSQIIESSNLIRKSDDKKYSVIKQILMTKVNAFIQLFLKHYLLQIQLAQMFYQMKTLQLHQKFDKTKQIGMRQLTKKQLSIFLSLVQYIYVETKYLQQMTQLNLQVQSKILQKFQKSTSGHSIFPIPRHRKIKRLKQANNIFINNIEDYYVDKNILDESTHARKQYLRNSVHRGPASKRDISLIGLWVGASLALLVFIITLTALHNVSFSNFQFSRDFPVWRGIAILIFYVWILGLDIYLYEKYKISHKLIFEFNDHHYSSSIKIFKLAGFHTSVFLILFLLYVLKLVKIFDYNGFNQAYFGLICWGIFIFMLILPLPIFNCKGRIFAVKLIGKSLISPFIGVTFPIVWMTDQLISLVTPLRDFVYTICYFSSVDRQTSQNHCNDNNRIDVILAASLITVGYRMVQCMRQGYDQGDYFCTPHFLNTLKYGVTLINTVASYLYRIGIQAALPLWIVFAVISTIYSYIWDLIVDWSLLQKNDRHPLLRKYINFQPARNYYIMAIANLFLRFSYTLTLSPGSVRIFSNSNIIILIGGSLEIIRRGIWNLLRIEKEHLQNCSNFKAVPDTSKIQHELTKLGDQKDLKILLLKYVYKFSDKRKQIIKEFITYVRHLVDEKQHTKKKYNSQFKAKQLTQIQQLMAEVFRSKQKVQIDEMLKKNKENRKRKKITQRL